MKCRLKSMLYLLLLAAVNWGCIRYKTIEDCNLRAGFTTEKDTFFAVNLQRTAEVQFIDSSTVAPGLEYEWDFRDGSQVLTNNTDPSHSFRVRTEPYRVLLTIRLGGDCVDTFAQNIWVTDGGPMAAFSADKTECLTNETVNFTSTSTNFDTLFWDFGNGAKLKKTTNEVVSQAFPLNQDYTVRLVAARGALRDTALLEIQVNALRFDTIIANLGPAVKIKQLPDRSYVLIGNTNVGNIFTPYCMLLDEQGSNPRVFQFTSMGNAFATDFAILPNSTLAITGFLTRMVGTQPTKDVFYKRLDINLNEISTGNVNAGLRTDTKDESAAAILLTSNSEIMIVGTSFNPTTVESDIYVYLASLDLGVTRFSKPLGYDKFESGKAVGELPGGFVIIGESRIDGSSDPDIITLKMDNFGNTPLAPNFEAALGVRQSSSMAKSRNNSNFMVIGETLVNNQTDFTLIKKDFNGLTIGNIIQVPDMNLQPQISREITPLLNNGFLISGIQSNNPFCFTVDENGVIIFQKSFSFSGKEGFNSGMQTADSGFIFAGYSDNSKLLIIKTDKNGNY